MNSESSALVKIIHRGHPFHKAPRESGTGRSIKNSNIYIFFLGERTCHGLLHYFLKQHFIIFILFNHLTLNMFPSEHLLDFTEGFGPKDNDYFKKIMKKKTLKR